MEHARSTLMGAEVVSNFEQGVSIPRCRQPGASDHISLRPTLAEARARYFWWEDRTVRHAASPAVAPYPAEEQEEQEFQRCLEYLLQKLDVFSDSAWSRH